MATKSNGKGNGNGKGEKAPKAVKGPEDRGREYKALYTAHNAMYTDIALFGGVLTAVKPHSLGIKGACQTTSLRSCHAVNVIEQTIGRCAVDNDKEKLTKDSTLGTACMVEFGYADGWSHISGSQAKLNGITYRMVNEYIDACLNWPTFTRSGMRPDIRFQRMHVFVHTSAFGDCHENIVKQSVGTDLQPKIRGQVLAGNAVPSNMDDYVLTFDGTKLPKALTHLAREGLSLNPCIFSTEPEEDCIQVPDLDAVVTRSIDIYHGYSIHMSNFQGDPETENRPRLDSEGRCYMTNGGFHYKVRAYLAAKYSRVLFMAPQASLEEQTAKAAASVGIIIARTKAKMETADEVPAVPAVPDEADEADEADEE